MGLFDDICTWCEIGKKSQRPKHVANVFCSWQCQREEQAERDSRHRMRYGAFGLYW